MLSCSGVLLFSFCFSWIISIELSIGFVLLFSSPAVGYTPMLCSCEYHRIFGRVVDIVSEKKTVEAEVFHIYI